MKKNVLSLLLAGSLAVSMMAGCGGNDQKETAQTSADGSVELSIWVHETESSDEGKLYAKLIGEFNEKYAGQYHATLSQIARSGDAGAMMTRLTRQFPTAAFRMYLR